MNCNFELHKDVFSVLTQKVYVSIGEQEGVSVVFCQALQEHSMRISSLAGMLMIVEPKPEMQEFVEELEAHSGLFEEMLALARSCNQNKRYNRFVELCEEFIVAVRNMAKDLRQ